MAFLVGDNVNRAGNYQSNNAEEAHFGCGGFVAGATGTATHLYIRIHNLYLTTALKGLVFSAAGALLRTALISSPATGWNAAALDSGLSVTSALTYLLGWIAYPSNQYFGMYHDGTSWNIATDQTGDYTTPPASVTPRADGSGDYNMGKPSIYLDGSVGGGASFPVPVLGVKRHRETAKRLGLFV